MLAFRLTLPLLLATVAVSGCSEVPAVIEYDAPHGETDRMLAGILPGASSYWFFKVAGPREAVDESEDDIREFLLSVTLDDSGKPNWKLPSGWIQKDGTSGRFKTIVIDSSPESLELSITNLGSPSPDEADEYLKLNVNRWREQMTLNLSVKVTTHEIQEYLQPLGPNSDMKLVDLHGRYKPRRDGASSAPMMGPHAGGGRMPPAAPKRPSKPLGYEVPEGWEPGELEVSRMGITVRREAVFNAGDGDDKVEISVTISRGSIAGNIARWMGLAGVEVTEDSLAKAASDTKVGGKDATLIDVAGEKMAIVGAIADVDGTMWFFKMSGTKAGVDAQRKRYREFLGSVVFP